MDKLYYNGNVVTMDPARPRAGAFLVRGGDFQAVGDYEALLKSCPGAECVDLQGKTVLPAFTETHMHVLSLGMFLKDVNLQHANGIGDVISLSRAYIETHGVKPGVWVRGRGWNQDNFLDEGRFLTRYDLDKISTEHPIAFVRTCGHVIAVNSRALELVGMSESAPQVDGGQIDVDASGRPLGTFREKARKIILDAIPEQTVEELQELIGLASEEALAHGITTIHTDDFKDVPNNYQKVIDAYRGLEAAGRLRIRIYEQCNLPATEKIAQFIGAGYHTGWGDEHFRLGPLKLLAYIQPIFLNYDISIVEDRVGPLRASTSYNWKEFVEKGIPICGGSDCPVESLNIMENLYTAVVRKNLKGEPAHGWRSEQRLTVQEAVESFTVNAAYASFEEGRKGSITPGKMADFVVLPEDIFAIDLERLKDIQVERTYLGGELAYSC